MRDVQRSTMLIAAVAASTLLWALVVLAQHPATAPVQEDNVVALRAENDRLIAELKKAHESIAYFKRLLEVYSARISELSVVRKEQTPTTSPATPEAGPKVMQLARFHSQNNLKMIGHALIIYANAHDQKGPATLEELRRSSDIPTSAFQSPLLNTRYRYVRYDNHMRANEVVAYEETDDAYTNILFADGFVERFAADKAAKIITDGHK